MTLTQSIELLENASARNFASRRALIDACDIMADKILSATSGDCTLPRGYRRVRTSHYYAQSLLHSNILILLWHDAEQDSIHYAVNHTAQRYCGDGYDDAPRSVLLAFAKDCATGLFDEISAQLAESATANEKAVRELQTV